MSYSDPISVTINAVAVPLPRISSGVNTGSFQKDDGTVKVTVAHTYGKRIRRTARIDASKIAADPFLASVNSKVGMSFYVVADIPLQGYSIVEQKQIVDGFLAFLSAGAGANITKLLGGEN